MTLSSSAGRQAGDHFEITQVGVMLGVKVVLHYVSKDL